MTRKLVGDRPMTPYERLVRHQRRAAERRRLWEETLRRIAEVTTAAEARRLAREALDQSAS